MPRVADRRDRQRVAVRIRVVGRQRGRPDLDAAAELHFRSLVVLRNRRPVDGYHRAGHGRRVGAAVAVAHRVGEGVAFRRVRLAVVLEGDRAAAQARRAVPRVADRRDRQRVAVRIRVVGRQRGRVNLDAAAELHFRSLVVLRNRRPVDGRRRGCRAHRGNGHGGLEGAAGHQQGAFLVVGFQRVGELADRVGRDLVAALQRLDVRRRPVGQRHDHVRHVLARRPLQRRTLARLDARRVRRHVGERRIVSPGRIDGHGGLERAQLRAFSHGHQLVGGRLARHDDVRGARGRLLGQSAAS